VLPDFYGRGLRLARSHHASDQWDDAAGLKVMLNSDDPTMFHTDGGNTAMHRSFDTERDGLEGELGPRP